MLEVTRSIIVRQLRQTFASRLALRVYSTDYETVFATPISPQALPALHLFAARKPSEQKTRARVSIDYGQGNPNKGARIYDQRTKVDMAPLDMGNGLCGLRPGCR
jgi:hypothetical protein